MRGVLRTRGCAALPRGPKPISRVEVAPPVGIYIGRSRLPAAAIFLRGETQSRHEVVVGSHPKRPIAVVCVLCDPDLVIEELLAQSLGLGCPGQMKQSRLEERLHPRDEPRFAQFDLAALHFTPVAVGEVDGHQLRYVPYAGGSQDVHDRGSQARGIDIQGRSLPRCRSVHTLDYDRDPLGHSRVGSPQGQPLQVADHVVGFCAPTLFLLYHCDSGWVSSLFYIQPDGHRSHASTFSSKALSISSRRNACVSASRKRHMYSCSNQNAPRVRRSSAKNSGLMRGTSVAGTS